jgi:hypothetical protein
MILSLKKVIGTAAVLGLVGGITIGVHQVSFAQMKKQILDKSGLVQYQSQGERQEKAEDIVASQLGMSAEQVKQIMTTYQVKPGKLAVAGAIAKLSHHPLDEVLQTMKQKQNWKEVLAVYHLEPKAVLKELHQWFPRAYARQWLKNHPAVAFDVLADYLGRTPAEIQQALYHSRVRPEGAVRAAVLSKASGKSFEEVLKLKEEKKSWKAVEQTLHIDKAKLKAERKNLMSCFRKEAKQWRQQWEKGQS